MDKKSAFGVSTAMNIIALPLSVALLWGKLERTSDQEDVDTEQGGRHSLSTLFQHCYKKIPNNVRRLSGEVVTASFVLQVMFFYAAGYQQAPVLLEWREDPFAIEDTFVKSLPFVAINIYIVTAMSSLFAAHADITSNFLGYVSSEKYMKILTAIKNKTSPLTIPAIGGIGALFYYPLVRTILSDDSALQRWVSFALSLVISGLSIKDVCRSIFMRDPLAGNEEAAQAIASDHSDDTVTTALLDALQLTYSDDEEQYSYYTDEEASSDIDSSSARLSV